MLRRLRALRWPVIASATIVVLGGGCALSRLWEPSRERVLQRILPSAVQIVVEQQEGRRFRTGSGVVIAARPGPGGTDCFVLTSGHTVAGTIGQKELYVLFGRHRGVGTKERATVLAYRESAEMDIALLHARSEECEPARPGRPAALGEAVWVIGFPWGRSILLASGIVSQVNTDDTGDRELASRLMVDASVSYGSSGGGVYDARTGGLIGLVEGYRTARLSSQGTDPAWFIDVPVPGQTFVTPLAEIRRFLSDAGHAGLVEGAPASVRRAER
ncbi:MAG TPA: trypsin-like peptidase domain-containing protein [Methylomirabilota bacterium]|nr:trypsin-like peptidase domain-containing protein [Methylomirabilota bacterium]